MDDFKAHEVVTVFSVNGFCRNQKMSKYIVVTKGSTSRAVSLVPLRDNEEVLQAREMQEYQVVVEDGNQD